MTGAESASGEESAPRRGSRGAMNHRINAAGQKKKKKKKKEKKKKKKEEKKKKKNGTVVGLGGLRSAAGGRASGHRLRRQRWSGDRLGNGGAVSVGDLGGGGWGEGGTSTAVATPLTPSVSATPQRWRSGVRGGDCLNTTAPASPSTVAKTHPRSRTPPRRRLQPRLSAAPDLRQRPDDRGRHEGLKSCKQDQLPRHPPHQAFPPAEVGGTTLCATRPPG